MIVLIVALLRLQLRGVLVDNLEVVPQVIHLAGLVNVQNQQNHRHHEAQASAERRDPCPDTARANADLRGIASPVHPVQPVNESVERDCQFRLVCIHYYRL